MNKNKIEDEDLMEFYDLWNDSCFSGYEVHELFIDFFIQDGCEEEIALSLFKKIIANENQRNFTRNKIQREPVLEAAFENKFFDLFKFIIDIDYFRPSQQPSYLISFL